MISTTTVPAVRSVIGVKRQFRRRRDIHSRPTELISVWSGGLLVVLGIAAWIVSGRDVGWAHSPALSPQMATGAGILSFAVLLHVLRQVGPIGTDPATTHWLSSTPIDRRSLLQSRVLAWTASSVAIGVCLTRALGLLVDARQWWPLGMLGAAGGLFVVGLAVLVQQGRRLASMSVWAECSLVVGAAAAALGPAFPPGWSVPAAVVAVLVSVSVWVVAITRSGAIRRVALTRGASLTAAVSAGASFFDVGLVSGVVEQRVFLRRGAVRSHRFPGRPFAALVWSDVLRHGRNRSLLVVGLVSWLAVWLAASSTLPEVGVGVVALIVGYWVVSTAGVGLRDLTASRAIRNTLGGTDRELVRAFLVVPGATAVVFSSALAVLVPWTTVVVVGVVATIGAYRARTAPPLSYDGLAVVTMFGAVPVDLIRQMLRGPGTLLVGVIALLVI
ncbi:MAG: DUF6297 family protein [Rhodococcus sp. (in: high G+C Gram-positive bacteria)]